VRVGIWQDDVDAAIGEIVTPLIKWLVLIVIGGAFTALFLAWNISRPIVRLVRLARRISHGELDAPSLGVEDKTEFGELARALERMRSSVKAAVMRLS
jgi:HAMP domain-containing protein